MRSRWMLHFLGAAGLSAIAALPVAGCHRTYSEMLVREGISGPAAPLWAKGDLSNLPNADSEVYFVGRGVAFNVLDEHAAVNAAREDVLRQLAGLISTRVSATAHELNARANAEAKFTEEAHVRTLPGPELEQAIARDAALFTNGVAGDLLDRGVHFEQWDLRDIREGLRERDETEREQAAGVYDKTARGTVRWKCWVLMSISQKKLEQRIEDFRKLVKDSYDRYVADYERSLKWQQEDRELHLKLEADARAREALDREIRLAREHEDRQWNHDDQIWHRNMDEQAATWEHEGRLAWLEMHAEALAAARDQAGKDRALLVKREEDERGWSRQDQVEDRSEAREVRRIMGVDRVRFHVTGNH